MSQSSLTDLVTALKKYNEPSADPHVAPWIQTHIRLSEDDTHRQPGDPTFLRVYFVDNLVPTEEKLRGLTTEAGIKAFKEGPILIDVLIGSMRIKGTYTIEGDKLDLEIGFQIAPPTYLKLGSLKGHPSNGNGPVTVKFDRNPDFYNGSVSVRVRTEEELAGMQTRGIFGGLLGTVRWKGLGYVLGERTIEILQAI